MGLVGMKRLEERLAKNGPCTVDGCTRPRRSMSSPWCEAHYYRARRSGDVGDGQVWDRQRGDCQLDYCNRPHYGHGYCLLHMRRVQKHGDPEMILVLSGPDSPTWAGDEAGYAGIHTRLANAHGPATQHPCVDCGEWAHQWSYQHGAPDERIDPKSGCAYSADPSFYAPRCNWCHAKYDRISNGGRRPERSAS